MTNWTVNLLELDSKVMGQSVPLAVALPPDFDAQREPLPLVIELHGGGADRSFLPAVKPLLDMMSQDGTLCPAALVTFSSGPMSWYAGRWEQFVVDELPAWMAKKFRTRTDRGGMALTGVSMGGYGTLKIGFKHPGRFAGIAALQPAMEPSFERLPDDRRNTFHRMRDAEEAAWGSPFDPRKWLADHPARIARDNAATIRESNLAIYLECGDEDHMNFHDGAEFLHRVLWEHDIRHEYHLVRWADHVGTSMPRRFREAHAFLTATLRGGLADPIDLPLTTLEQEFVDWINGGMLTGAPPPNYNFGSDPARAASVHAALWKPKRASIAAADPEMRRAYAKLPPAA